MNCCVLGGTLTDKPEFRVTPKGSSVCTLRLQTEEIYQGKISRDWHTVVLWGDQAETANRALNKGDFVVVQGRYICRTWENRDGVKQKSYELSAYKLTIPGGVPEAAAETPAKQDPPPNPDLFNQGVKDDLPF